MSIAHNIDKLKKVLLYLRVAFAITHNCRVFFHIQKINWDITSQQNIVYSCLNESQFK